MRPFHLIISLLYLALPVLLVCVNLQSPAIAGKATSRWPSLQLTAKTSAVAQLDLGALKQSISRLPAVALLRETGDSLRLLCGQKLRWCIWGDTNPPMLFTKAELWTAEGLTPENQARVDDALANIYKYHDLLHREGWTLIMVPVPTKLSIYQDCVSWPSLEKNPLSRQPIPRDRAGEVYDRLVDGLRTRHVPVLDLRALYLASRRQHPHLLLYPLGESHWSGAGMKLAADAVARMIHRLSDVPLRPITPRYLPVVEVADLAAAFDPLPQWLNRLQGVYRYHDRLVNGDVVKGFQYAQHPTALLYVAGTSYSGQFTWHIGEPVGFAWVIGGQLEGCEFHNGAEAGRGSFAAFADFLSRRAALAADFSRRQHLTQFTKIVVWEYPIRDLQDIAGQ